MLILTRKLNDEIVINSGIRVKILSATESHVKIGITAPSDVEILRGEIYESVKNSTIGASMSSKEKVDNLKKLKINKIEKQ
jgi:carbon storage regulator